MKKNNLKIKIFLFFIIITLPVANLYSKSTQKEIIIPMHKLPEIVDVSKCSEDDAVYIKYEIENYGNTDTIKSAEYYLFSNNKRYYMGRFDTQVGFINSTGDIIYNIKRYDIVPIGLATTLLQYPTSIVGIVNDNGILYETEVLFILSFDFEKMTILRWIPEF